MKLCPFCAEEIQDAAIVCKHCGRDLAPPMIAPAPPPVSRLTAPTKIAPGTVLGLTLLAAVIAVVMLVTITQSGRRGASMESADRLETARELVRTLERQGVVTAWSCKPNKAVFPRREWSSTTAEVREPMLGALALVCNADGGGPKITIVDENGYLLADYNGAHLVK